MVYENDEIIEASVTKSRPGQKIGLGLEEKNYKSLSEDDDDEEDNDNDNCSRDSSSIFVVTEIGGLFQKKKLPIRAGDVLLEVNGMPVTNKGQFPNGLKDIRTFLKGTWSIRVKVGRNNNNYSDDGETSATEEITQKSYLEFDQQQQQQQPEDDISGHRRYETDDSGHRGYEPEDDTSGHHRYETDDSGHRRCDAGEAKASDVPVVAKRRGRRKGKKETLGARIRDARSKTPSDRCRGTRRGKRPSRLKVTGSSNSHSRSTSKREREIDSSHTRSTVSTDAESGHSRSISYRTMETRKPEADFGHNRGVNNRTIETRVSAEVDSSHSGSTSNRKNGHHLLMKMKEERRMSEAHKGGPSFVNDNFASHSTRSISFVTMETRNSEAAGSAHSRSTSNRMMEPRETQCTIIGVTLELNDGNRVSVNSGTSNAAKNKISGVQCTDSGVTLELKDGNRVSVEQELMKLVSEENGTFVAASKRTLKTTIDRPSLQRSPKCIEQLTTFDSDDDSISKDKPLEVPTLEAPTLQDLRNLLKKKNSTWDDDENTQILPDVRNLLENTPGDVSIENLMKQNPWAKTSLMSSFEEHSDIDSTRNVAANAQQQQPPTRLNNYLSLRNLLGERLQTTNPKKWEESSMVSSTLACMTNLIDPGDLMKIRNFASRPKLNGATVEIVKKTEAMYGYDSNRWDVEVIQRKNQSPSDALQDLNRFISVAAENLKHFV